MKTLYLKAAPGDIADYVIFSGDPGRVKKVCSHLSNVKNIACNREFETYTGNYKGMPVTVTSTGIGAPSAAIAMEEMYECGMKVAVRLGTVMGLIDNLGGFIIPRAAIRRESTSSTYVEKGYPAAADIELVSYMNAAVKKQNGVYTNGIICSMDGYYSEMKSSKLSEQMQKDIDGTISELKKYNVVGLDMETSLILTLGSLMNIKACSVTVTTILEGRKGMLKDDDRIAAEEKLITVVLEGQYSFANDNR